MPRSATYQTPFGQMRCPLWGFILFWAVIGLLCLWGIWGGSLATWDEGLTAERSREMFRQGWSMTVHKFGQPDFNKPPLYYWMAAAGFSLFGLGEFAARLPSALMGLACMAVVYRLARGYGADKFGGLLAVFLLAASAPWLNLSREALLDSGMTLSMLLGLWAFAFHPRPIAGAILAGAALAFGFWLKNPGVLIILPAMFAHSWTGGRRDYRRLALALGVACTLGCVWYVHQYLVWGDRFVKFFFDYNLMKRVTADFEGHRSAWNFYLLGMFKKSPHILVIAFSAMGAMALRWYKPSRGTIVQLFFLVPWLVAIHIMHSKRQPYILPAYPFLAIAGGEFLTSMARRFQDSRPARIALCSFLLFSLAMCATWYDVDMDNNPTLKDAAIFMAENCPDETRFTLNAPPHVVSFYLDAVVGGLDESSGRPLNGPACILYNEKNNAQLPAVLSNAMRIWSNDGSYGVWRITEGIPGQNPTP